MKALKWFVCAVLTVVAASILAYAVAMTLMVIAMALYG